jgi:hypothetical protein
VNYLKNQPDSDILRKIEAWGKCLVPPGYDGSIWRWDAFGSVICWSDYGSRSAEYGWEIDHIVAVSLGGSDHPSNLRALHWRNNASLGGALSGVSTNAFSTGLAGNSGNALSGLAAISAFETAMKRR